MKDSNTYQCFTVEALQEPLRLDKLLSTKYPEQSRSYFQKLIEDEKVLLNGSKTKKRITPAEGDLIEVHFTLNREVNIEPEDIPLDIIYEDDYLLAINKPPGLVVHPAPGNWSHTFVNGLLYYLKRQTDSDNVRPGIVHRLDKDTSGVLLAAKDEKTQQKLTELFSNREIEKTYFAISYSNPGVCVVDQPIGRHPQRRQEMTIINSSSSRPANTVCSTLYHNELYSLVKLKPKTGRTHQLRVHLRHLNCPIVGDLIYGPKNKTDAPRQLLHAHSLSFIHPITKQRLIIEANIHKDLIDFLKQQKLAQDWELLA
ncbi:MAG: RluA family pseudouridine synthase [Chlamydiales bacterium]|nr:RluA family pseudouridine synthase [Chlamydiales bacterium]NCF70119.1 RluA family pseudouridine synthase [Chlamydiales bacterium]